MKRHRIRIHAFDVGLLHPARTARRQWEDRLRVEQHFLGLSQQRVTFLLIDGAIRFVEQRRVFRVPPARAIISTRRVEQTKKRERIHVIRRPASTRDSFVFKVFLRREKRSPFHNANLNGRAKGSFPQRLNELSVRNIIGVGIDDHLDVTGFKLLRIKIAGGVAIAGIGQEPLRFLGIERVTLWLRITGENSVWRHRCQRLHVPPISQRFFVYRHVQGLAHADVGGRSFSRVEKIVIDRRFRLIHEIFQRPNHIEPGGRHSVVVHGVEFACLVKIHHRRVVLNQIENDSVKLDVRRVPIHWVARDVDTIVVLPGPQLERPAGDDVPCIGPCGSEFFDRFLVQSAKELMRHHAEKVRRRFREGDAQSVVVNGFHAHVLRFHGHKLLAGDCGLQFRVRVDRFLSSLFVARDCEPRRFRRGKLLLGFDEILFQQVSFAVWIKDERLAAVERFGVFYRIRHRGIPGANFRRQTAADRVNEIARGDWIAI